MGFNAKPRRTSSKPRRSRRERSISSSDARRFSLLPRLLELLKPDSDKLSRSLVKPDIQEIFPNLQLQQQRPCILPVFVPPLDTHRSELFLRSNVTVADSTAAGSHTIEQASFVNCDMITFGNTAGGGNSGNSHPTNMSGHTFKGIQVTDSAYFHFGNTGRGSEGHKMTNLSVKKSVGTHSGDFSTAEVKYQYFQACHSITKPHTRA
ncbi:hypothetical protein F5Y07DRAFT_353251 [Xylaria sp. FL0933]|nr:hypothetical protein F5Y07DRAFT_353251 [Xylaria sp. FL0933]